MKIEQNEIPEIDGSSYRIAIVLPYFNEKFGNELLENCLKTLKEKQVLEENIEIVRTAGALEIPFACQKIINSKAPDAIIALAIVIRGETYHFELVCDTCHQGIMKVQLEKNTPIIFGILSCENKEQVMERISETGQNKGKDAALAALLQLKIK